MARSGRSRAEETGNRAHLVGMRALAHPLRLRLLELLAEGGRTTKQAAAILDEPPTRLYHHVHALERAGLLRLRETRRKRGTHEKYYEVPPPILQKGMLRPRIRSGRVGRREILQMAAAMLEATRREVATALADRPPSSRGGKPFFARVVIRSEAVAERIRGDLAALIRRHAAPKETAAAARRRSPAALEDASANPTGRWSLTILLVPPGRERRDRGGRQGRG